MNQNSLAQQNSNTGTSDASGWEVNEFGVKFQDIQVGTGEQAKAAAAASVQLRGWNYTGNIDESRRGKELGRPSIYSYSLDLKGDPSNITGEAILAGVIGMRVGGKRTILAPWKDKARMFDLELLAVAPSTAKLPKSVNPVATEPNAPQANRANEPADSAWRNAGVSKMAGVTYTYYVNDRVLGTGASASPGTYGIFHYPDSRGYLSSRVEIIDLNWKQGEDYRYVWGMKEGGTRQVRMEYQDMNNQRKVSEFEVKFLKVGRSIVELKADQKMYAKNYGLTDEEVAVLANQSKARDDEVLESYRTVVTLTEADKQLTRTEQATKIVANVWNTKWTRCGTSSVAAVQVRMGARSPGASQGWNDIGLATFAVQAEELRIKVTENQISTASRLNGLNWEGSIEVRTSAARASKYPGGQAEWTPWETVGYYGILLEVALKNTKSKDWEITKIRDHADYHLSSLFPKDKFPEGFVLLSGSKPTPISCDVVPKY